MKTITHLYAAIMSRTARTTLASFLLLFISISVMAQSVTDGATPSGLAPGSPAGSYPLSDFDVVNLYNGTLNFRLPLYQVGGRGGAAYPIILNKSKKWSVYKHLEPGVGAFYYADGGWWSQEGSPNAFGAGKVDIRSGRREVSFSVVETLTRVTFTAPDGTEYELRDQLTNGQPVSPVSGGFNRGTVFVTADGTTATFVSDWNIIDDPTYGQGFYDDRPDGYMMLKDGTRFRVDDGQISWMRDRNGNKITFGYDSFRRTTSITDSLNRQITITYADTTPGFTTISFKGFGGATRTVKLYRTTLSNALRSGYTLQTIAQLFPELSSVGPADSIVTSYIELPDGRKYQFRYNPYSELARVELPTGGAIEYDYAAGLTNGATSGVFSIGTKKFVYRRIIERRVYPDGGSGNAYESRTTYSRPETTTTNAGYVITETYNGSASLIAKSQHYFNGSPRASFNQEPTHYDGWKDGREYKTEVFDTNGSTILTRVDHTFAQRTSVSWWGGSADAAPPNDPRTTETVTTIEPGSTNLVTKQTFGFDDTVPFNNQNNVKEYGFNTGSAGSLMRETRTTFVTSTSYTDNAIHLRGLPSQVSVYDGGGTERVRTVYEYDNYATDTNHAGLTNRSNISGFDSAFTTSYTTRGNATATTRHLMSGGASTGSISTYAQYDIAGNIVKSIDGRGNATSFFYTDCFGAPNGEAVTSTDPTELGSTTKTFAYVTEIRNALNQSTFAQFDYYLGQAVDGKDFNDTISSGYFNDNLDRPTEVRRAVGTSAENRSLFTYDDTNRIITVATDRDTNQDGILITKKLYDLMGRAIETRQYEGGTNYIAIQTQYDAFGRPFKTSNPFRPWQSETAVWTTKAFDALGRVTSITTPDSAVATTTYSGNSITASDQLGKQRKSITDALGRVIEIYEAPNDGSLNYLTSYTYDMLDNVTAVTQGTQTPRTFVYDSLKRLTSTTNPESGTVSFQYDNNGNLLVRSDARGVSTHLEYDVLNRSTRRWYNGSSSLASTSHNSPALPASVGTTNEARFYYDAQSLPGAAPSYTRGSTVGRLVAQVYGSGSNGDYFAYDLLGRQTLKIQQTGSVNYQISAAYNLAGAATSITYPSGRTISNTYDAAGRVITFSGNLGDGTSQTYSNEIIYSPFGSLAKEKFGTTTPIYNKLFYNIRGQLAEVRASTSYTGPTDYDANRGGIVNSYSNSCTGICSGSSMTDNNGSLKKQDILIPGQTTRAQEFGYDNLNRLLSARELVSGVEQWKQQFTYDRWGNRTINTGVTYGTGINNKAFTVDTTTNRLGVPGGQSGVMQYDDAGNLKNDTYTGAGTRTYDGENKITSAWGGNNQAQLYDYDTAGRRIKRTVNGVETWQVYGFSDNLIAEYAASGSASSPQKEYGYRNGELLLIAETGTGGSQDVSWTNAVGVSISGNNLTRTMAGDSWSTGAISSQMIASGDGYAEFTANNTTTRRSFGLTSNTSVTSFQFISYGIHLDETGTITIHEGLGVYGTFGTYTTGDKLRVSIEGGVVKYRKNGTLLRTSTLAPTYPLYAGGSIYNNAGTLTGAVITSNLHSVAWTNAVGVSISGNNLTRTMAGDSWSTGAVSSQSIASGDGYAEFTANNTSTRCSFGLTSNTSVTSFQFISYGIHVDETGTITIHEGLGVYGTFGTYTTGDKLRVSIEGGVVKYRKNGTLLRTSTLAPTYPLYAGGSIYNNAGTLTNAILTSGTLGSTPAQFRWLVSDHLGTPRIILDQTGDLANIKRHDYLPFGEELFAGTGGRSSAMGYAGGDNVRQQFTKYERDVETGLDYANARYYSSVQGRFTSPDPLAASGHLASPQSWNRYTYVLNDPLAATDPSGLMWVYQVIGKSSGSIRIRIVWKDWKQISKKDAKAGYKAIEFGGQQSKDVTLTDGSVVRLHANSDKEQQISGPKQEAPSGGYVNTGLVKELGRQTEPIPAATGAFIGISLLGGYAMPHYGAAMLLNSAAFSIVTVHSVRNPEEQTSEQQTMIMAGSRAPEYNVGHVSESGFLDSALRFLGPGYKEVEPGRYVSADGMRQLRFGKHETGGKSLHGHFEAYDKAGGKVMENSRVQIRPK